MGEGVRRATSRHEEKATTKYIQVRICGGIAAQCASPGEKCDHVEQNCTRGKMRLLRHPRMRVLRYTVLVLPLPPLRWWRRGGAARCPVCVHVCAKGVGTARTLRRIPPRKIAPPAVWAVWPRCGTEVLVSNDKHLVAGG